MKFVLLAFAGVLIVPVVLGAADVPAGWAMAGSRTSDYEAGTTQEHAVTGTTSAYLRSKPQLESASGFGTLMQSFGADQYRGERLRLSVHIRAKDVIQWAGLWMRIDGKDRNRALGFDNMRPRPIQGTNDWQRYDVVLDVPEESVTVAFGVLLVGQGHLWIDGLKFETVGRDVPVTNLLVQNPANLDFETEQ